MFFRRLNPVPESANYTPSMALQRCWQFRISKIRKSPTYQLLMRLESARVRTDSLEPRDPARRNWLLPFRQELHELLDGFNPLYNSGELLVVRYYLLTCPRSMIAICVWLISRLSDRNHLHELKAFSHSLSPQIRRHVAKAFWRLEAWAYLREMAKESPEDARIQWFATAPTAHRSFKDRLRRFTAGVDKSHAGEVVTPSQMPYWAQESSWTCTPPKSVEMIRRMLRRIQHWVRWGTT